MQTSGRASQGRTGVVIPIRSFALGKARLAAALGDEDRSALARRLAEGVARAARPNRTVIVSSASDVVDWAADNGLECIADPGDLDLAAHAGVTHLRALGATRVVVAHADLARAESFAAVIPADDDAVVIVPCQRNDGTPVLSVPAGLDFRFAYGPGSARRHELEALRLGAPVSVLRDEQLGFDIDLPEDLEVFTARVPTATTPRSGAAEAAS